MQRFYLGHVEEGAHLLLGGGVQESVQENIEIGVLKSAFQCNLIKQ